MKLLFLTLILPIFSGQSIASEGVSRLSTIYVQSEDASLQNPESSSAFSIESEQIQNIQPASLDDLLKVSASTTTSGGPRSSSESVQIRGLDAGKLYIYIDGVKQNFRTDHSTMIAFDYDNLKSAIVEKDNSNLAHSGSLGGGLVLKTKSASDYLAKNQNAGGSLKLSRQNSNSERSLNFKSFSKMTPKSELLMSFGHRKAGDTVLANRYTLVNSSYEDASIFMKYDHRISKSIKFNLSADYFKRLDDAPMNPTLDAPSEIEDLNSDNKNQRMSASAGLINGALELKSFITTQKLEKTRKSDKEDEIRQINSLGLTFSHNGFVKVGAEIVQDSLDGSRSQSTLESYPEGSTRNLSVFVQKKIEPIKNVSLEFGSKYQTFNLVSNKLDEDRSDAGLSSMVSIELKPLNSLTTKLSANQGFNAPKVQEVFADGLHHPSDGFFIADNFFIPNLELQAEKSRTIEFSQSFEKSFSSNDLLKVTYQRYWTHFENYIYLEKIDRAIFDGENGTTQFVNAKDVSLSGHEISSSYMFDQVEFQLAYSKIRAINKSLNTYVETLPADQFNYGISYYLDRFDVQIGYLGIHALKQDRINRQTTQRTDETPGYFTHNIYANKKFTQGVLDGFKLSVRIDNLTNRVYRKHTSNIVETGKDYKLSLEYGFNI